MTFIRFVISISQNYLKAEVFCPHKRQSSMRCFIAFNFHEHLGVKSCCRYLKRAIGKATLHKLPIYNEYMCLCSVSTLFCRISYLFSNCSKSSTTRFLSLSIKFPLCCEHLQVLMCPSSCNAMKRSIDICLL